MDIKNSQSGNTGLNNDMSPFCDKNPASIASSDAKNMASVSDDGLYNLCKQYGERARIWRQRFAGLLPEVSKRKLYEKKGFISIFEFAKKLAGMSEEQVRLVLNLEKRFSETPTLKMLLTSGKVSVNKLARVVSIVTPENEKFLAMQVQILSKNAVETLVRDEKFAENMTKNNCPNNGLFENQNGLFQPLFDSKSLLEQTQSVTTLHESQKTFVLANESQISHKNTAKISCHKSSTLNLSQEIQEKLLELQQKGIDINELLKEFLQKREEGIAQRKAEIVKEMAEKNKNITAKSDTGIVDLDSRIIGLNKQKIATASPSRHIPISIKRIVYAEHGTKCSIKNCQKPSEQIHHTQRFSVAQSHDPHYLAPLCKEHHELAHSADLAYREIRGR